MDIKDILGVLVAAAGFLIAVFKLRFQNKDIQFKHYELIKELVELIDDPNRRVLLAAGISVFTQSRLCEADVRWFLSVPNAIRYIKQYASARRYVKIERKANLFTYRGKYKERWSRIRSFIGLLVGYLLLSAGGGAILILSATIDGYELFSIVGVFMLLFSVFFANGLSDLDQAKVLVRAGVINDD